MVVTNIFINYTQKNQMNNFNIIAIVISISQNKDLFGSKYDTFKKFMKIGAHFNNKLK